MLPLLKIAALAVLLAGCRTPDTAVGAATMSAAAVAAAVANRAQGGCIALCTNGTVCNPNTGLCERDPCQGRCDASERCEETFSGARCVRGVTGVAARADGGGGVLPIAPVLESPDSNRTSPTIVPAAERNPPK